MILKWKQISQTSTKRYWFMIMKNSPDTDVFLLLIYYYDLLPMATTFRTGRGASLRDINIRSCVEAIGVNRSKAILGFHTFTGCDQTSRFNKKSKSAWWKVFMEASDKILQALTSLGENESLPSLDTIELLENFVASLYGHSKCPEDVSTLCELRWYLFSKYQCDADMLPPYCWIVKIQDISLSLHHNSTSSITFGITTPANGCPMDANGCQLWMEFFGWMEFSLIPNESGNLIPIMTDDLPAPIALIELSSCSCKSQCSSNRCRCRKNGFSCTDMCKCIECHNVTELDEIDDAAVEIDEYEYSSDDSDD